MSDLNPRAVIGGNSPPPEPREAIGLHIADLIEQVEGSAFGQKLENEQQAAAAAKLLREVQDASRAVDAQAKTEKAPHEAIVKEVNAWRNSFNAAKLKGTPDGKLTKAETALGNLLGAWMAEQEEKREAEARQAAAEAERLAKQAIEVRKEALQSADFGAMDEAESALDIAKTAIKQADRLAKDKPRIAVEGERAITMRKTYTARVTNYAAAYGHYKQNPQFMADFHALLDRWAQSDARSEAARCAGIAGVEFTEGVRV